MTLAEYFMEHLREQNVLRFWFDFNKDTSCEFCKVQEVLIDSKGDLQGLMLSFNESKDEEYCPMTTIVRWLFSEDDQVEVMEEE